MPRPVSRSTLGRRISYAIRPSATETTLLVVVASRWTMPLGPFSEHRTDSFLSLARWACPVQLVIGEPVVPSQDALTVPRTPAPAGIAWVIDLRQRRWQREPGQEDTRIGAFFDCLSDAREIVEGFAPDFPS